MINEIAGLAETFAIVWGVLTGCAFTAAVFTAALKERVWTFTFLGYGTFCATLMIHYASCAPK